VSGHRRRRAVQRVTTVTPVSIRSSCMHCVVLLCCLFSFSCVSSSRISSYKEVQFHGSIEFARDIEAIVVNSRHLGDARMMSMVEQFRKNNNCNVVHMEAGDDSR
jgi:hypothetical protein